MASKRSLQDPEERNLKRIKASTALTSLVSPWSFGWQNSLDNPGSLKRSLRNKHRSGPSAPTLLARDPITFLSLSKEIQDTIYGYVLISPSPLIAWAGMHVDEMEQWQHDEFGYTKGPASLSIPRYIEDSIIVEKTASSLLRCNSSISRQAAKIFYRKNTFRFFGEYTWGTVVEWLNGIGPVNREHLTKVEFGVRTPQHVWQLPSGVRTQLDEDFAEPARDENEREQVYPRSHFLHRPPGDDTDGVVENINPAIEDMMRLLGRCDSGPKLTISMLLRYRVVPGVSITNDHYPFRHWFGMDLPNVLECCRHLHTAGGEKKVAVLWKIQENVRAFGEKRHAVEGRGWEVVGEVEDELAATIPVPERLNFWDFMGIDTWVTLRRKRIYGTVLADDPSPHSWAGC
ncbi:uncharacterized protein BP5553_04428 [Venustampulla echinocandica]|uniref:Uncharacterized protein n=1 Tax=Venustampulla echinocandica TaxID=2656787 RepID=A0A370TN97_9HELO|nr:uncharacterized protein BP5553_04428 [Venustampulla echinocandica]RDL36995.1 hypothetical protein BP5553_04428 [Venustampulla echinocandica]